MILRPALTDDAAPLAVLARDAFVAAFGTLYPPEHLAAFLGEYRTPGKYAAHIADPAKQIMLAEVDGTLVGYALIILGEVLADHPHPRPQRPVLLSQLYCAGTHTGRGVGEALMQWAIAAAQDWGADCLALSVYSENYGAQRFYQRHGFAKIADTDFYVGGTRDAEFLYARAL